MFLFIGGLIIGMGTVQLAITGLKRLERWWIRKWTP